MRIVSRSIVGVAATALSFSALAGVSNRGHFEWDIEFPPPGVELFPGSDINPNGVTFRLHFVADESLAINGFNLGTAANPGLTPERLYYNGNIFNHVFGGDTPPNPVLITPFPQLAFDSYFAIGSSPVSFVPGSQMIDGSGGEIIGTWFTQPPVMMSAGDRLLALQVTLQALPDMWIGGAGSTIGVGFADNTVGVFDIPFAQIPSPGAATVLVLGALAAHRRRR